MGQLLWLMPDGRESVVSAVNRNPSVCSGDWLSLTMASWYFYRLVKKKKKGSSYEFLKICQSQVFLFANIHQNQDQNQGL